MRVPAVSESGNGALAHRHLAIAPGFGFFARQSCPIALLLYIACAACGILKDDNGY
jgi:hypothetical protein